MKETFDFFMKSIVNITAEKLGKRYRVRQHFSVKNNDVASKQISISDARSKLSLYICMDTYYDLYRSPDDIPVIAGDIVNTYRKNKGRICQLKKFVNWEWARSRIMFQLINTEKNINLLKELPHYDIPELKLSVIFYILICADNVRNMSIQINNRHKELWGITETVLMKYAQKNTAKKLEFSINNVWDILCETSKVEDKSKEKMEKGSCLYMLTNEKRLYGAGCILYQGVLKQIAENFDSGFYILPSSIHEVMLLPSKQFNRNKANELKKMVTEINHTELKAENILIDAVYYYDGVRRKFYMAD